jgi:hypothetical protein
VPPSTSGWSWPKAPDRITSEGPGTPPPHSTDPLVTSLFRRIAGLSARGEASEEWEDRDKLANLDIGVWGSAGDAHRAMAALDDFSRAFGRETAVIIKAAKVDHLGDEATVLVLGGRNGPQVTYHWRRGNIVVEAHIQCFGRCPPALDRAARAWVAAIDAAAAA